MKYFTHCLLLFSLILPNRFIAQNEGNIWYFGEKAGINFNNGNSLIDSSSHIITYEGSAVRCDAEGNLLFYTNGGGRDPLTTGQEPGSIWNRNHEVMYNMSGTQGGGWSSTQSSIIVPKPGDENNYYLFTMDEAEANLDGTPPRGFSYFEIDMEGDGGLGAVVDYQESLVPNANEGLSACRHANGQDYWVIIANQNTNQLNSFLVDEEGVNLDAEQDIPDFLPDVGGFAPIRISPDETKLYGFGTIFDFDNNSGLINNPIELGIDSPYGVTFSPNSNYLYFIEFDAFVIDFIRFDLSSDNIPASKEVVAQIEENFVLTGQMQVAPDGNLYFLETSILQNSVQLSSLLCPNAENPCLERGITTYENPDIPFLGLPNFTDYLFADESITPALQPVINSTQQFICNDESIELTAEYFLDVDFLWSTGDTTETITVNEPGIYSVTISQLCCNSGTTSIEIVEVVEENFELEIEGLTELCEGESNILSIDTTSITQINWSNGSIENNITVSEPGNYTVTVTDICSNVSIGEINITEAAPISIELIQEGDLTCSEEVTLFVETNADSILWSSGEMGNEILVNEIGVYTVSVFNDCSLESLSIELSTSETAFEIPNAFTPNGDGVNDEFGPIWYCEAINMFEMVIFNRWGQEIFNTSDPFQRWDGTSNRETNNGEVFIYKIYYLGLNGEEIKLSGDITLIR